MKKEKTPHEKMSFAERLNKHLDISPDVLPNNTNIMLRGRNSLSVSGTRKILLYTDTEICLDLGKTVLSVKGKRLLCSSYHTDETKIDGLIESLSFMEKEQK